MPCKHAALALIYAKQMAEMDEPWKLWQIVDDKGRKFGLLTHPHWDETENYQQIPKTIQIGIHAVPEPMREKPENGACYWAVSAGNEDSVATYEWRDDTCDSRFLANGVCHFTKEAAIAHAKALFSFSEGG